MFAKNGGGTMTSGIIYHDFQSSKIVSPATEQDTTVALTASLLAKGRRLAKLNSSLQVACIALCGACIGVSGMVLWILFGALG